MVRVRLDTFGILILVEDAVFGSSVVVLLLDLELVAEHFIQTAIKKLYKN